MHLYPKIKLFTEIFLFIIIGIFGAGYMRYTFLTFKNEQAVDILRITRSVEATLPKEIFNAPAAISGIPDNPQYLFIKKNLEAIVRVNTTARYAFIYFERNGKLFFYASSEPAKSKNYVAPGQEFTDAKPDNKLSFEDGKERIIFSRSDARGNDIIALVPVKDELTGKPLAILGIAFNPESWNDFLLVHVIESGLLIVLLLSALFLLYQNNTKNKLLKIEIKEHRIAENEIRNLNETLEQRIADRTNQLETINRQLEFHIAEIEQFTFIASHDLQEPLLTITTFGRLLHDEYAGKLEDDGNQYLVYVLSSVARMRDLVKGLMDYSLLGKSCVMTMVDCKRVVGHALESLSDSVRESQAVITVGALPMVHGYELELGLLFRHLIANSIKFRRKLVRPEIEISAESLEKEWVFKLKDNGIGIEKKDMDKVFIIFKRLHNRNEFDGIGIGLSHCKKIVELHGGKIWIESSHGNGCTIFFTIPKRQISLKNR